LQAPRALPPPLPPLRLLKSCWKASEQRKKWHGSGSSESVSNGFRSWKTKTERSRPLPRSQHRSQPRKNRHGSRAQHFSSKGLAMAEDTKPVSQPFGEAAAQAVAPDAVTATLLAKHTAGDKLTASEY